MSNRTVRTCATRKALGFSLVSLGLMTAFSSFAASGEALDPEKAGIPVYKGAKADAATTDFVRTSLGMQGAAFRTGDGLAKVAEFYGKQAGVKPMGEATKDAAAFAAGCKEEYNAIMKKNMSTCRFHVTVQNPWMDMKTGKMVNDTLITIVKQQ